MNRHDGLARCRIGLLRAAARIACVSVLVVSLAASLEAAEPMPQDPKDKAQKKVERAVVANQDRQQQIEQFARTYEPFFHAVLAGELELARKTCGSLDPAARRRILAAGRDAVPAATRKFAEGHMGSPPVPQPMQPVLEAIQAAVKQHAKPEEFAAYSRERAARLARRERAARTSIVAKLDQELQLSIEQRSAVESALEKGWDPAWLKELGDQSVLLNGRPPAPDYADGCIAPHLDERQRAAWKLWCSQASASKYHGQIFYARHGHKLEPDPWWTP